MVKSRDKWGMAAWADRRVVRRDMDPESLLIVCEQSGFRSRRRAFLAALGVFRTAPSNGTLSDPQMKPLRAISAARFADVEPIAERRLVQLTFEVVRCRLQVQPALSECLGVLALAFRGRESL